MAALRPRTLALGTWLAARGALAGVGIALSILGALGSVVAAVAVAGAGGAAVQLPLLESSVIAWGAGVMLAFGGALHAIRRDLEQGVVALVRARGASVGAYVRGRVGGLVVVLAVAVGGATLVAGIAATSVAHPAVAAARTSAAALVYALAFAGTLGPVAMAALGARTRAGGYLTLVAVLVRAGDGGALDGGAPAARVARADVDPGGARGGARGGRRAGGDGGADGAGAGGAGGGGRGVAGGGRGAGAADGCAGDAVSAPGRMETRGVRRAARWAP